MLDLAHANANMVSIMVFARCSQGKAFNLNANIPVYTGVKGFYLLPITTQ